MLDRGNSLFELNRLFGQLIKQQRAADEFQAPAEQANVPPSVKMVEA